MPGLLSYARTGLKSFRFSGTGGGISPYGTDSWGWWNRTLAGAQYDYRREAGNLWENTIVYALLSWQADQFTQSPFAVGSYDEDGHFQPQKAHPAADLLQRPNAHWTTSDLWGATLLSLNVAGNAYWIKVRSEARKPVELWWVPHWMIWPIWPRDGSQYITGYNYRVDGKDSRFGIDEVIHFRGNLLNPLNDRVGLGSFSAALREVCTENEAGTYEAAMLRNRGVPGVILSPKGETVEAFTPDKAERLKTLWNTAFTGDNAGRVFMATLPLDVTIPQFTPDNMTLPDTRAIAAARICAGFGVDPMVIGLPSEQRTYANYSEANRAAWDHNVLPAQCRMSATLNRDLLWADYDPTARLSCGFDTRNVPALQEDTDGLYTRLTAAVGGPWLTPNEAREQAGLQPTAEGDELTSTVQARNQVEVAKLRPAQQGNPQAVRSMVGEAWRRQIQP